ncbi:MAG: UbiA family prenyltransferase [Candidatus Methanoperedens sp.]|nr:UbiA family prenyltransferase [Candidatus Methanoperedens sp.]
MVQKVLVEKLNLLNIFGMGGFGTAWVYDFRDVKGDEVAGLKTLPTCLGERKAQKLLQAIHILLHLWITVSMLLNFIKVEITVLLTVWLTGMIYTSFYTRPSHENEPTIRKVLRDVFVDGEFILAIFLRTITGF